MGRQKFLGILVAVAVAAMTGCGSGTGSAGTGSSDSGAAASQGTEAKADAKAESKESYKIYLITMDQIDQHWVNMNKGCEKAVGELGAIEYKWSAPDQKDDAKQIECINNADAAGVKIVYVDSPANYEGIQTLATDNKSAGKSGGEEMLKALEAAGITSGKIGIITPNAATNSNVNREMGFKEALEGAGFEILETQYSEGDAAKSKDIAANYIAQGCVGIFGCNEGCTVGIGNAIREAGTDVMGIGFDKSDTILELVKEGSLVCTITQNPDLMGYEGIKTAVKALKGEEVGESYVDTGVSIVDAEALK